MDEILSTRDIDISKMTKIPYIKSLSHKGPPEDLSKWGSIPWLKPPITSSDFAVKETHSFYNDLHTGKLKNVQSNSIFKSLKGARIKKIKQHFEKGRGNIEITTASNQCWAVQKIYNKKGLNDFWGRTLGQATNEKASYI